MIHPYKQTPIAGVDLDSNELRIAQNKAAMIKNMTFNVNRNDGTAADAGFNFGVLTPLEGNQLLSGVIFPSGNNYCMGYFQSIDTNEAYVFVYNSNLDHFIYKIDGATGAQAIVYKNSFLNFQLNPENFIKGDGRCVLKTQTYFDTPTGTQRQRKFLIFTDNYNPQRQICVDDSIATNSYTTSPYFDGTYYDHSLLINLGVPTPLSCIGVDAVPIETGDEFKQNNMRDKMWQWRVKFINVWQQESEHGIISDSYSLIIGGGCIVASNNFPRCVNLTFDCGNPLVDKIQIEFRTCSGNAAGLTTATDWFLYDTIDKYDNTDPSKNWWQRPINPALNYNPATNTVTYKFCADKEAQIIPVEETNRLQNNLPLISASVFPIGQEIALANNVRNFEPIDENQLEKIDFTVTPPVANDCDNNDLRNIVIYASIYNPFFDEIGFVGSKQYADSSIRNNISAVWGRMHEASDASFIGDYKQTLPLDEPGFLGYMRGTNSAVRSVQVIFDPSTGAECEVPIWDLNNPVRPCLGAAGAFYQKFVFKLPPGKYVFALADPMYSTSQQYQKTSTYVYGTIALSNPKEIVNKNKNIIIDCCDGDVILNEPTSNGFMIMDLSNYFVTRNAAGLLNNINYGYIYEDQVNSIPVELVEFVPPPSFPATFFYSQFTDHNGFFFSSGPEAAAFWPQTTFSDCVNTFTFKMNDNSFSRGTLSHVNHNDFYAYTGLAKFNAKGQRIITGNISLCIDNSIGIQGVLIVFKNGPYTFADKEGNYKLILHNRYGEYISVDDIMVISQAGQCEIVNCNQNCGFCIDTIDIPYIDCCSSSPTCRNTVNNPLFFNLRGVNVLGLQNGGRYGFGIMCSDWLGRVGNVQVIDKYFKDIPSITETHTYNFSTVGFNFDPSIRLPSWVCAITIFRTKNLLFDNFITWVADEVQFVDNGGNENTANPTQIRIYYNGLNEYNKQFSFTTNTVWQFATQENGVQKSVFGDQVEFIQNGDQTWFPTRIISLVQYDSSGTFFSIDYTENLKDLKKGAIIKLFSPKQWQEENIYYEQCVVIPVVNGIPALLSGTINAFDAYMLSRQIPNPEPKLNDDGSFVTNTNSGNTPAENESNGVIQFQATDLPQSYPAIFEHHSPSDFWGDHCANLGRINVKNPYERKQYLGSEIQPSKALNNGSDFNGLSYYDIADRVLFDEQEWGKITAVLPEMNILLIITEKDAFVVSYNESNLKLDANGNVMNFTPYGKFSPPHKKTGQNYGCQLKDINTIVKNDGIVMYIDRADSSLIAHNYAEAKAIEEGQFKGYLNNKLALQNAHNVQPGNYVYMVHAGLDPKNNEYYLTFFQMPKYLGLPVSYINNSLDISLDSNETIIVDMQGMYLKGFASFTPEYYGALNSFFVQRNMFTFKNAYSYFHHQGLDGLPSAYNNFYGIQCKKSFTIIVNAITEKVKIFLYNEVYCKQHKFIIDQVTTEAGQLSRVRDAYWDKRDNFYCASYLCDLNTPADPNIPVQTGANKLLDGDQLHGRWATVRYVSQDADDGEYCEVSAVINYFIASEKSGN